MQLTLYMATSADGFIATPDGNSDWVSPVDTNNFLAAIKSAGCLIVGHTTYQQFLGDLYPVAGVTNLVVTSQPHTSTQHDVHFITGAAREILTYAEQQGHHQALLIGGGTTNAMFAAAGLINQVILTVHPLFLGQGIPVFKDASIDIRLSLIQSVSLPEGLLRQTYQVLSAPS